MLKTIIRVPNHLGDSLMAQGAIRAFAEMTPDRKIHLLLPGWARTIYNHIPYIKLLPVSGDKLHGLKAIGHQTREIRREKFGSGIVLTPSFSSALIMFLAGIKSRCGYDGEGRGILLNVRIPGESVHDKHRSERYHYLLERVAGHPLNHLKPSLTYSEQALARAGEILKRSGVDSEAGFIVIAPRAVAPSRRWGSENYRDLALNIIEGMGLSIVLLGTENEYSAGQEIKHVHDMIVNLCGETDIELAGAVMALAKLFVGNDSGLAHLAAAVQTPLVVLSGADNPAETSPISDKKTVIIRSDLDCISCVKNICPLKGERFMRCMKEIKVKEVYNAVQETIIK
jgi:lipopolysaccharide heptosyltransferase II